MNIKAAQKRAEKLLEKSGKMTRDWNALKKKLAKNPLTEQEKSQLRVLLLKELEAKPAVAKMFSSIATSRSFTAKAAHKAFAGL